MYESKDDPLLPRRAFLARLAGNFGVTLVIVAGSLVVGGAGYHHFGGLPWDDAVLTPP
jgi:hypothetical protein